MTLWRHKCQFGRFLGHCGRFLGHCGRVSRPIALKFGTNIHMVEMHQIMRKKISWRNDVITLWRHECRFERFLGHCGRFLGHCGRVSRPIALKFGTNIHMVEMHQFMRKKVRDAITSWRYDVINAISDGFWATVGVFFGRLPYNFVRT